MKERLTVTLDPALAANVRRAAHDRGTSVSALMEGVLRSALTGRRRAKAGFAERWSGRFRPAPGGSDDPRLQALKAKYRVP